MTRYTKVALATVSLLAFATTAAAQTDPIAGLERIDVCTDTQMLQQDMLNAQSDAEFASAAKAYGKLMKERKANNGAVVQKDVALRAPQLVFVDFVEGNPFFSGSVAGRPLGSDIVPGVFADYEFTDADKAFVMDSLREDYEGYKIEFTMERPESGPFSTLLLNDNDANPIDLAGGILFGRAQSIDFGNTIRDDVAFADASLWKLLYDLGRLNDPDFGNSLTFVLGLDPVTGTTEEERAEQLRPLLVQAMRQQTANTAAHELGHNLGLRHHDSFGGIGEGLPPRRSGLEFFPIRYDMFTADGFQRVALETFNHLMASGASTGISLRQTATESRFLSERSAVKLAYNAAPFTYSEDKLRKDELKFVPTRVRNTIEEGVNAGEKLKVREVTLLGNISELDEVDTYNIALEAGDVFSAELILDEDGDAPESVFAPLISLVKTEADGSKTVLKDAHWGFEGWSPFMMDVEIEETGVYEIVVEAPNLIVRGSDNTVFDLALFGLDDFRLGAYTLHARTISTPLSQAERFPEGSFEDAVIGFHPAYPFSSIEGDLADGVDPQAAVAAAVAAAAAVGALN